ncbi:MAG TPA: alternative ribosome rescue aminoacyl-tRNA hydrolase ArfB [Nocardioidaceae bacterium]|nr:alternative ribosome rescue aminoacyl-tRNA hydrolase ArfB [Nocardioidaceae bacterium]
MPGSLTVKPGVVIPEGELRWRFSRSSGPGGQSVNTTDSRVELSFDLGSTDVLDPAAKVRAQARLRTRLVDGVVTVTASEHRSQLRNRVAAEERLAALIRSAIAPPPPRRKATRPTRGSVQRRLDSKSRRSTVKRQRQPPRE